MPVVRRLHGQGEVQPLNSLGVVAQCEFLGYEEGLTANDVIDTSGIIKDETVNRVNGKSLFEFRKLNTLQCDVGVDNCGAIDGVEWTWLRETSFLSIVWEHMAIKKIERAESHQCQTGRKSQRSIADLHSGEKCRQNET